MEIIRSIRSHQANSHSASSLLLHIQEVQVVALVLLPITDTLFQNICEFLLIFVKKSGNYGPIIVLTNLLFNFAVLVGFLASIALSERNTLKKLSEKFLGKMITKFRCLLFVPILSMNSCILAGDVEGWLQMVSLINLVCGIALGVFGNIINWSYRFVEKDFCARREIPYSELIMLCSLVILKEFLGNSLGVGILAVLSIIRLNHQMKCIEYKLFQEISMFYTFLGLYICSIVFPHLQNETIAHSAVFLFEMSVGIPICKRAATKFVKKINQGHFILERIFKYRRRIQDPEDQE